MTLFLALFIDPNVTSLYRLYRDRLSKAFLFNPDPKKPRDTDHDLPAYEPKLSELNMLVCPYPIINAALNIEGSRYAIDDSPGTKTMRPSWAVPCRLIPRVSDAPQRYRGP
jgi:hypothetical protein